MDWGLGPKGESVYEYEDEEVSVSDSNRFNADDGGERLLSSTHATFFEC